MLPCAKMAHIEQVVKIMADIADSLMNIARTLIIVLGGGIGLVRMVKGKSDENPKEFGEGLATVGAAGVLFAATFAFVNALK